MGCVVVFNLLSCGVCWTLDHYWYSCLLFTLAALFHYFVTLFLFPSGTVVDYWLTCCFRGRSYGVVVYAPCQGKLDVLWLLRAVTSAACCFTHSVMVYTPPSSFIDVRVPVTLSSM